MEEADCASSRKPSSPEAFGALPLGAGVAQQEAPGVRLIEAALRGIGHHRQILIEKRELRARPATVPAGRQQAQPRAGDRGDLLEAHRRGQVQLGEIGRREEALEQIEPFRGGHPQGRFGLQQRSPAEPFHRERRDPAAGEQEPRRAEQDRKWLGRQSLLVSQFVGPAQRGGHHTISTLLAPLRELLAHLQPDLPGRAAVPFEGRTPGGIRLGVNPEPAGGAEHRQEEARGGRRDLATGRHLGRVERHRPPQGFPADRRQQGEALPVPGIGQPWDLLGSQLQR